MTEFHAFHGDWFAKRGAQAHATMLALREKHPSANITILTDPPYSARTHKGRRTGAESRQALIPYEPMTEAQAKRFVKFWAQFKPQFWIIFGDHVSSRWWLNALKACGQYPFAPVPWVKPDAAPRQVADGPASGTEHIAVGADVAPEPPVEWIHLARWPKFPRRMFSRSPWFCEPTASTRSHHGKTKSRPGTKPAGLLGKLMMEYTEPGDIVVDPFAGTFSTGAAALEHGCIPVLWEIERQAAETGTALMKDLARQPPMFPYREMTTSELRKAQTTMVLDDVRRLPRASRDA